MKLLKDAGLLDSFTKQQQKCLKELIKNQQDFISMENERNETEKSLFKVKGFKFPIK